MGCMFSYTFLLNQPASWKEKYIKGFAVVGSPFGGNFKYLYGYLADNDYPTNMFKIVRQAERTYSARTFLFPRLGVFKEDVFVKTSTRTYSARDIKDYLYALNYTDAYEQYLDTKNIYSEDLESPGNFPILCLTGVGQSTVESVNVEGELHRGAPYQPVYGDGDEYINTKSSRSCIKMANDKFVYRELVSNHMDLIRGKEGIGVALDFITSINKG